MTQATPRHIHTSPFPRLLLAMELSASRWKLGLSNGLKTRIVDVEAGNMDALLSAITEARAKFGYAPEVQVLSCYEAGRDGFWIHRFLTERGFENVVIDSASIPVDRRKRRSKTDGIDVKALLELLGDYALGKRRLAICRVPSVEAEDLRRVQRGLQTLKKEQTIHRNRISSWLITEGVKLVVDKDFLSHLQDVRTPLGTPLPPHLKRELADEYERLKLVIGQIKALERELKALVVDEDCAAAKKVVQLTQLCAIGPTSAWQFTVEFFGWRTFNNRREVAAAAGLAPTPFNSGDMEREQGISKAGNARVRAMAIEIAWCWLRYQPGSELSKWFHERFGTKGKRSKRVGIVALARKVLIALWRYVEHGIIPTGAKLKGLAD